MKRTELKRRSPLRAAAPAKAEVRLLRKRKCEVCKTSFRPRDTFETWCSHDCALILSQRRIAAKDERDRKAKLLKLQPRSYWMKRAQDAVNAWVRLRDADQPCISCGAMFADAWHAGHFYSTAARQDLRFDPANIHKQCAQCNLFLHGNLIEYRRNLPARIGQAEVDRLSGPPTNPRATVAVLQALEIEYRRKAREAGKT